MDLLEYWKIIRKRLWLIVLLMLLAGGTAAFYTSQQEPQYRASTTLFINPGQVSPLLEGGGSEEIAAYMRDQWLKSLANTYTELIQTRSFLQLVAAEMGLPFSETVEEEIDQSLSTSYVRETQFYRIAATHPDPATAQKLANTAAEVLIARDVQRQQSQQEQIAVRHSAQESQEQQKLAELIAALDNELAYYDEQIEETEAEITQLSQQIKPVQKQLDTLHSRLSDLRYAHIDAQMRLSNAHARLEIAARRGLQESSQEQQKLEGLILSLHDELAYYDNQIEQTETEIARLEQQVGATQEQLDTLRSQLPDLRYARIDVQTRLTDAHTSQEASHRQPVDTAVVLDWAMLPEKPVSRQLLQRTLLATIVGLMLGVGITFLLEYIDYTVKTPEELDAVYEMPTQGVIGMVGNPRNTDRAARLVTLTDTRSPAAETFRALRTVVQVAGLHAPIHSLLVTSAGPGEGKTFVAANLAVALAQSGKRVIIVDTDLRKPTMHHFFGLASNPGFTNMVIRHMENPDLDNFLLPTTVKNLWVLPCGKIPSQPAELLGTRQAIELMQELTKRADIVIYDSPPVATVTDAAVLAQRVDAVLHVVWAGQTRINVIQWSKATLERVGARILGPVLNRVHHSDLGYYTYYYSYGYYYGNGGKNGQKETDLIDIAGDSVNHR